MSREILIVAPYLPWPADFGGAIRIYELMKFLAHNHRVVLLAPAAPEEMASIEHLRDYCDVTTIPVPWTFRRPTSVRKRLLQARSTVARSSFVELASWEPRFQAVMDRLFMTRSIDLVHYEFPQMARYLPQRPCPTVLDNHNIEHQLLERVAQTTSSLVQRVFNNIEFRKVRRLEYRVWAGMTLNVATSARDAEHVRRTTGRDVAVIPNGVDVAAFDAARTMPRVAGRVVFTGAMRHQPNADGACWYVEKVHPLVVAAIPHATLEIVGADPPPDVRSLADSSIVVTGRVPAIQPHIGNAQVAIVPLRSGSGTRLKILEAFASDVPVVSTTIGAEGIDAVPEGYLWVADDPRAFAEAVIHLLRSGDRSTERSSAGALALTRSRYDWTGTIGPALVAAHDAATQRFRQT